MKPEFREYLHEGLSGLRLLKHAVDHTESLRIQALQLLHNTLELHHLLLRIRLLQEGHADHLAEHAGRLRVQVLQLVQNRT